MCPDFPSPPGGGATAAQVWAYGTRGLTVDTANAIRDAILSDATKIPGANVDAAVSTRSPSSEYDAVLSTLAAYVDELETRLTAARAGNLDKIQEFAEDSLGTLTATGAEDEIRESLVEGKLHAFIDLTAMQAADSITVREYMKIKAAGSYIKYAEEVYADVQSLPMLYIVTKPSKHGVRITLEQTAGTYRSFDWETFIEKAA